MYIHGMVTLWMPRGDGGYCVFADIVESFIAKDWVRHAGTRWVLTEAFFED